MQADHDAERAALIISEKKDACRVDVSMTLRRFLSPEQYKVLADTPVSLGDKGSWVTVQIFTTVESATSLPG